MLKRLHQCKQTSHLNDLNNFNNHLDKINSQLDRADIQKRILIKNIYREYELYLNLVRNLLHISVEKALIKFMVIHQLMKIPSMKIIFYVPLKKK